jgi:hypothetical protein
MQNEDMARAQKPKSIVRIILADLHAEHMLLSSEDVGKASYNEGQDWRDVYTFPKCTDISRFVSSSTQAQ